MIKMVVVSASWSRESMIMRPKWQEVINQTKVSIEQFDFDQQPDIVAKFRVQNANLPVCIVLDQDDHELIRFNGEVDVNKIIEAVRHFDPSLAPKTELKVQLPVTPKVPVTPRPAMTPPPDTENASTTETSPAAKKLWAKWREKINTDPDN
jgi:thioredoxin-like negative regulator of GroEL